MLVAGRDDFIEPFDKIRLNWRWKKVVIDSQQIRRITFDQMLSELDFAVETYPTKQECENVVIYFITNGKTLGNHSECLSIKGGNEKGHILKWS